MRRKLPHLFELLQLLFDRRRIEHLGRGQVRGETFQHQMWRRLQRGTDLVQIFRRDPQTAHAGIDLQMNRMPGQTQAGSGLFQQFDLARLPNRGRQLQTDDFFFFAAPEPRHQQDAV